MRTLALLTLAILSNVGQLSAQIGPISGGGVQYVTADPSGACTANSPLRYNGTNGKLWGCNAGTWTAISSGGGGGAPSGPAGGALTGTYPNPGLLRFTAGAGTLTGPAVSGTVSQAPGANAIPQLDASGNLAIAGRVFIGSTDPGAGDALRIGTSSTTASIQGFSDFSVTPIADLASTPYLNYKQLDLNGSHNFVGGVVELSSLEVNSTGSVGTASDPGQGTYGNVDVNSETTSAYVAGVMGQVQIFAGTVNVAAGNWGWIGNYGATSLTLATNYYGQAPLNGGTLIHTFSNSWVEDLAGSATNPYYSWNDSRGVGRCKEDNTFDAVGQNICAVYNPQFTKYVPAAANYERIIYGQWNGNVAEIGAEAGGTGTLRKLRILGKSVQLPNAATPAPIDSGALAFNTTTNNIEAGQSSGTVVVPTVSGAITNGHCLNGVVTSGKVQIGDAGVCPLAVLTGTSSSIGGGLLTVGTCASGTVSVTGATTSMGAIATPATYPGDGNYWEAYVSSSNTVTVKVCATATLTPTASTYNVRVIQ